MASNMAQESTISKTALDTMAHISTASDQEQEPSTKAITISIIKEK